jgi:hypothetical protein
MGNASNNVVNLMTGRRKNPCQKSKITKSTGGVRDTNTPNLIKSSIDSLQPCPFNPKHVIRWLEYLQSEYESARKIYHRAKEQYDRTDPEFFIAAEKAFQKAQGRYINDERGIRTILNQKP